jgi:hypothetical protein
MILRAIAAKLKRRSKDDFRGRHFEAALMGLSQSLSARGLRANCALPNLPRLNQR